MVRRRVRWRRLRLFALERLCGLGCVRGFQGSQVLVREVLRAEHLTVPAFEAVVFVHRDQHRALPAVAGDDDRLGEGKVLVAADVPLGLGGGHLDECGGLIIQEIA